jgi:integrating conjugative element protein (TIGR03749 family)
MRLQRRVRRRCLLTHLLSWVLVLGLGLAAAPARAEVTIPERIVWQKVPIALALTVGKERRVDFPGPVEVGLPAPLQSAVRVQSIAGSVYLLAHDEFDATRVRIRETETGRMYLLDLSAKGQGGSGVPVEVYASEEPPDPGAPSDRAGASAPVLPSYGYVTLTRFAAQQLYAPARLLRDLPGVVRVPVKRAEVALMHGASVTAEPLVAWRAGDRYLTAVKLTNQTDQPLTLDPRSLRGDWLSAAFQHHRLLPNGDESDTTALYLISKRPFEVSL